MKISISTRHGHLSEASQSKIEEKLGKLSRIFDRLTAIDVTIDLQREETPSVDLRVSAEHKHDFVATDCSTHLMGSVDTVIHRMEQQLRKYKEKIQNRHRNSAVRDVEPPASEAENDLVKNDQAEDEQDE